MASISLILETVFAVLFDTKTENNTHPKRIIVFFYFKCTRFVPFKFKELHGLLIHLGTNVKTLYQVQCTDCFDNKL